MTFKVMSHDRFQGILLDRCDIARNIVVMMNYVVHFLWDFMGEGLQENIIKTTHFNCQLTTNTQNEMKSIEDASFPCLWMNVKHRKCSSYLKKGFPNHWFFPSRVTRTHVQQNCTRTQNQQLLKSDISLPLLKLGPPRIGNILLDVLCQWTIVRVAKHTLSEMEEGEQWCPFHVHVHKHPLEPIWTAHHLDLFL